MKLKLTTLFCLSAFLTLSSYTHPLKLTTSLIEYDAAANNITIECRVFIDDFQGTLQRPSLDAAKLTKEDIDEIEYYFDEFYRIVINGNKLSLTLESSEVLGSYNVLSMKFKSDDITINKGDALFIENRLFFESFGPIQSNKMTIRIPPFMSQDYQETTFQDYTIDYQF